MKRLTVLRHAKSSWKDRELDDFDRPLNGRGRKAARRIHRLLNQEGYTVRGVQKVLRDKEAQAVEVAHAAHETSAALAEPAAQAGGVDVFRLISLRDRLVAALES